jgi:uncharacterized protein (TIGR03435 family)
MMMRHLRMRSLKIHYWIVPVIQLLLFSVCGAQVLSSPSYRFAVATIKPSNPNRTVADGNIGFTPMGSFHATFQSLKELIEFVQDFGYYKVDQRIIGGPRWLSSAKFDITAKCDEETASAFGTMSLKQKIRTEQEMVQALLLERFKLRTHNEMRRLAVYALIQTKSRSKMNQSRKNSADELGDADGPPGNWKASGVTMKVLANEISTLPEIGGKIVVDRTGLEGNFDFVLRWTPDSMMGPAPPGTDEGHKSDSSVPSLLTALQEQLGLKLETTKASVDVIVIDSAELPSPN